MIVQYLEKFVVCLEKCNIRKCRHGKDVINMKWMKRLFKHLVIFLICYFVVNMLSFFAIKSTYKTKEVAISFNEPKIEIIESKATITNGYIKGIITNNTSETLINKILKLDFLSPRNVMMGTKYVDIGTLLPGQSTEFKSEFNFDNVNNIALSLIDKADVKDINKLDFSLDSLSDNKTNWRLILLGVFIFFGTDIAALAII